MVMLGRDLNDAWRARCLRRFTTVLGIALTWVVTAVAIGIYPPMAADSDQARNARALTFQSVGGFGSTVSGVVVSGTIAYASRGRVLDVLDVSDPAAPQLLGTSARLPSLGTVRAVGEKTS